jgi:hypothetical protein
VKPVDFRNETFRDVLQRVNEARQAVLDALCRLGPRTTRRLARDMGWDVLDVRPRVTELYQIGAVVQVGDEGREGVYAARTEGEWMDWFGAEQRAATTGDQMLLRI